MDNKEIRLVAEQISAIITETDADFRGNVLYQVGMELIKKDQNFTADLFKQIGMKYGIK